MPQRVDHDAADNHVIQALAHVMDDGQHHLPLVCPAQIFDHSIVCDGIWLHGILNQFSHQVHRPLPIASTHTGVIGDKVWFDGEASHFTHE
eukprot:CAMPEP_0194480660 /NCGR_PEP_ID=MMETSP0253-20130528/3390_1 /TAXON_ID=2966 /ORGANISM="Noctiluca scintillans" /LENGTH=90 /DNA_ID=CAMNT_0039320075 /DNA_START=27 /DNA_END=296 /DNA_ORIENTATION=+